MKTQICMFCSQKNDTMKTRMLQRIVQMMQGQEFDGKIHGISWGKLYHCKYGMHCNELQMQESECMRLERQFEGYINGLIKSRDNTLYHEILQMLRGYFPAAYMYLEREWHRAEKQM